MGWASVPLLSVRGGAAAPLPVQVSSSLGVGTGTEHFRGVRARLPRWQPGSEEVEPDLSVSVFLGVTRVGRTAGARPVCG